MIEKMLKGKGSYGEGTDTDWEGKYEDRNRATVKLSHQDMERDEGVDLLFHGVNSPGYVDDGEDKEREVEDINKMVNEDNERKQRQ